MKKVRITRLVTEQAYTQGRIPEGTVGYRNSVSARADQRWRADKKDSLYVEYGPMIAVRFLAKDLGFGGDKFIYLWVPMDAYKEVE